MHLDGTVAAGKHRNIDVDSVTSPLSQGSVAVVMENKLADGCQLNRAFNLVFDLAFGDWLTIGIGENESSNV